jgi:hypothetical protein
VHIFCQPESTNLLLKVHVLIGRTERNRGNGGNHARHGNHGHVTIILACRSRCVTLDAINHPVIQSEVASDRFEAVSPRVVRLDTLVCYDRANKVDNALVAAFRKQGAIVGGLNESQQTQIYEMPMHGH